jgi:hypothetical protein
MENEKMTTREKLRLEKKAIKLQRQVMKIVDELYEVDEIFADSVNESLQDESFLRG